MQLLFWAISLYISKLIQSGVICEMATILFSIARAYLKDMPNDFRLPANTINIKNKMPRAHSQTLIEKSVYIFLGFDSFNDRWVEVTSHCSAKSNTSQLFYVSPTAFMKYVARKIWEIICYHWVGEGSSSCDAIGPSNDTYTAGQLTLSVEECSLSCRKLNV